jgi:hypothetical protein
MRSPRQPRGQWHTGRASNAGQRPRKHTPHLQCSPVQGRAPGAISDANVCACFYKRANRGRRVVGGCKVQRTASICVRPARAGSSTQRGPGFRRKPKAQQALRLLCGASRGLAVSLGAE